MEKLGQAMGQAPVERLVAIGAIITLFYFIPSLVAFVTFKQGRRRFLLLNLATGWTFAAWFALLFWAITGKIKPASQMPNDKTGNRRE